MSQISNAISNISNHGPLQDPRVSYTEIEQLLRNNWISDGKLRNITHYLRHECLNYRHLWLFWLLLFVIEDTRNSARTCHRLLDIIGIHGLQFVALKLNCLDILLKKKRKKLVIILLLIPWVTILLLILWGSFSK